MGRRSRSVPPTARLEGGSAPTPSATAAAATPTPGIGSVVNHPLPPRPPVDISKYASKALMAFVEAKSNMGHNNSHPEGRQTPVGQATSRVVAAQNATGTSRGRAAGPPGSGTPLNTSARLNLPSSSSSSSSSSGAVPLPLGETVMAVGQTSHSRFDHSSGVVAHSPTAPAAVPLPQISRRSRPPTRREVCKTTNLPYCCAVLCCSVLFCAVLCLLCVCVSVRDFCVSN